MSSKPSPKPSGCLTITPAKSSTGWINTIRSPAEFFLRPYLYKDKFPEARNIQLPADLEARIRAQNAAGQIVFGGDEERARVKTDVPAN
jgi:hypothetical protein